MEYRPDSPTTAAADQPRGAFKRSLLPGYPRRYLRYGAAGGGHRTAWTALHPLLPVDLSLFIGGKIDVHGAVFGAMRRADLAHFLRRDTHQECAARRPTCRLEHAAWSGCGDR